MTGSFDHSCCLPRLFSPKMGLTRTTVNPHRWAFIYSVTCALQALNRYLHSLNPKQKNQNISSSNAIIGLSSNQPLFVRCSYVRSTRCGYSYSSKSNQGTRRAVIRLSAIIDLQGKKTKKRTCTTSTSPSLHVHFNVWPV